MKRHGDASGDLIFTRMYPTSPPFFFREVERVIRILYPWKTSISFETIEKLLHEDNFITVVFDAMAPDNGNRNIAALSILSFSDHFSGKRAELDIWISGKYASREVVTRLALKGALFAEEKNVRRLVIRGLSEKTAKRVRRIIKAGFRMEFV